ncbi:PREDICTED: uncharacterized protein LOC109171841 [Ipomoea nil]|uniref:uncharacterized protein LOC109171841 n=1 Tax=Ipomoea nil TaxID=35883 RepID=UPI0009009A60|nr:PREDICTED: uncharacterized protein LOC109171841 [Ipomoea nil]
METKSDGDDFSFVCDAAALLSPVAAEDAFYKGEIRPVFPLFKRDLLFTGGGDFEDLTAERLPVTPPVKKVFVETNDESPVPGNDEIAGPYCQWSSKPAQEDRPEVCKKSNSTGFSKLWRFKDFLHRSNSDGRDAFVFLNPPAPSSRTATSGEKKKSETKNGGEVKVKAPQKKKKKSESVLAHERYMRSKAKDDARRRSYLPYRPELVGLFTNVNGGLTRNVHPF